MAFNCMQICTKSLFVFKFPSKITFLYTPCTYTVYHVLYILYCISGQVAKELVSCFQSSIYTLLFAKLKSSKASALIITFNVSSSYGLFFLSWNCMDKLVS